MKKPLVAAAVAVVLALGGGATAFAVAGSAPEVSDTDTARVAEGSTAVEPDAPDEEAPDVANEPVATSSPLANEIDNAAAVFIGAMRNDSLKEMDAVSDEELIADGRDACEQLAAGAPYKSVQVISVAIPSDPNPGWSNENLVGIATETFCPEFNALRFP